MTAPLELRAIPNPLGNRIDLEWVHPDPQDYPGMRIVRRRGTWPTGPYDGEAVVETLDLPYAADSEDRRRCRYTDRGRDDRGLAGETVFYYMLFPFRGSPPEHFQVDVRNRVAAMATSPCGYGARMAALLPAIYHRYDHALVADDQGDGPLRRFLEIPGSHLDQLHSLARSVLDLHDLDRVDGRLLPLLASWIGWPTDHRLEARAQRSEIRKAPHVYRTVGLVPTVEATVKRILGWESRTKELAHNVFLSNRPERLNLWLAERDAAGTWSRPTEPLSLNYAYEGRPAAVRYADGTLSPGGDQGGETQWLFFHTLRKRTKESWKDDASKSCRRGQWDVWYKTYSPDAGWTASRPLTDDPAIDKHPSAARQGGTLWVFWDTWSESDRTWHLCCRTRLQGEWSPRQRLWDDGTQRRQPQAVTDGEGRLWLFWLERIDGRWQVRYNRHNGTDWEGARSLRGDDEEDPRTEDDLFVLVDPAPRLWVFWARRDRDAQGQWRIAYRVKPDLDLAAWNWDAVRELPPVAAASDREPAAIVHDGHLELYWSSNRDRSWSVWRAVLDDPVNLTWSAPQSLTRNPFSQRAPLPVAGAAVTRLFFYSNESLTYDSATYGATRTVDGRYAGCTTVDVRNAAKTHLWGSYDDFQTYSFGTAAGRRRRETRYAHDTVVLHVTPSRGGGGAGERTDRERHVLERVLRQFLPIQVRAMLVIESPLYQETVYTYDFPAAETPRAIRDGTHLKLTSTLAADAYDGARDDHKDRMTNWVRIHSWSVKTPHHRSVDTAAKTIDTSQRTWHVGLEPGFDFSLQGD